MKVIIVIAALSANLVMAASITLPPIQILGADSCTSWTLGGTVSAPTATCNGSPPIEPPIQPPIEPPIQPPVSSDLCAQYGGLVRPIITLPWGNGIGQTWHTQDFGGFGQDIFVFRLIVPPDAIISSSPGSFPVSEYAGPPTTRLLMMSLSPCDFRALDPTGRNGPFVGSNGAQAVVSYAVTMPSQVGFNGDVTPMLPGNAYYINLRNADYGSNTSSCASVCNAIINYQSPRF